MIRKKFLLLSEKDEKEKLNERINTAESYLGEMCTSFAAFARKLSRFRDKHDELAKVFRDYSEGESINTSLSTTLESLSKGMTILADYMDIEVHRLELKVVSELAHYGSMCKSSRDSIKTAFSAHDREVHRQKQLVDIKTKFASNSSATDSDLLKVRLEVNRSSKEIDEIICNFEKTKLKDIKSTLQDFISIQLKYHSRAVEILSASYYDVCNISEQDDFQEFRKHLKAKPKSIKNIAQTFRSKSLSNLGPPRLATTSMKHGRDQASVSTKDINKAVELEDEEESETEDSSVNSAVEDDSNDEKSELDSTDDEEDSSVLEQYSTQPVASVRHKK